MANENAAKSDRVLPDAYRNRAILRPNEVFRLLGIGPALGWKLINDGPLERVQLGPRSVGVTCASVERLILSGVPAVPPETEPQPEPTPQPRLIKRPRTVTER